MGLLLILSFPVCSTCVSAFALPSLQVRGGAGPISISEIKNGRTSDGKRRLLSMQDLLSGKGGGPRPGGLFSRDGAIKLVGAASVAYFGKQVFNGGAF